MRIENDSSGLSVFINNDYIEANDYNDKDNIIQLVKRIISKLQDKLLLRGFYKIRVFPCKRVGLFIDIIKIDDIEYSNNIDLRVMVFLDEDVYVGVDDYFLIEGIDRVRYYDGRYYVKVDDIYNIFDILEFGRFIYGKEAIKMLNSSKLV